MSQWKDAFTRGIACFRSQEYEQALASFSEALLLGGKDASVYDSRAAVYEKLGKRKEALLDSKQVIYLAPDLWKGYARAARLFQSAHRYDSALKMINMALARTRPEDARRLAEFEKLRQDIETAGEADRASQRRRARETFYHFGNLPLELATTIFTLALEDNLAHVVVLAQVCREWRSVILGTSALWDTLVLTTRNPSRKAKIWKERSQGRLRKLDLRDGDMKIVWALNEFQSTPLHRLRELVLRNVRVDHFFQMLPTCTPAVIHNLEHIELDSLVGPQDRLRFTEAAGPQLRHLIADDTPVHWTTLADTCQQLRTLVYKSKMSHPALDDFLWFLHCNPSLETLEVMFFASIAEPSATEVPRALPPRVSMPALTRLVLSGIGDGMSHLFALLSLGLPSLQVLHLVRVVAPVDHLLDLFFTPGSVSRLTEIKVDRCGIQSKNTLVRLLESAPDLQIVKLAYLNFVNPFVEGLATPIDTAAPEGASPVRCPKLSHLEITHCPDVNTGPVVRVVKLRNPPTPQPSADSSSIAKIATLVLDGCMIEADVVPWLRQQVPNVSYVYQTKKQAKWRR